jgi:predicted 3-demethylubiquinone-9 3-methyltransferase (glyoxalase superfamily)
MLHDADQEKSGRVTQAMFQMKKIDIKALEDACER